MAVYSALLAPLLATLLVLGAVIVKAQDPPAEGHCVWYGECGQGANPYSGYQANCPYNGTARPLPGAASATLAQVCPELAAQIGTTNGSASTCCSADQLTAMSRQMSQGIAMLGRCPSCVRNFRLAYCYMTCAPDHSMYMSVTNTSIAPDTGKTIISRLNFTIASWFAEGVYSSCKDISMPSTNTKVMSLMCGSWGAFYCNAQRWFSFMGSTKNGISTFDIDYIFGEPSLRERQFSKPIVPCNMRPSNSSRACSCVDCQAACPMPPIPVPDDSDRIEKLVIAIVGVVTATVWCVLLLCAIFGRARDSTVPSRELWCHIKCPGRLGHKVTGAIQSFFTQWGTFVGKHPVAVIILSILTVVGLSCGIMKLIVTTDPVELWASPASLSRVQKDYFDDHFEPFYRTEMLIIRPVGLGPVTQQTPDGPKTWGPAFNKDFLLAVAELQNYIQDDIIGADNTTLSDICFKPLSPDNTFCTIQSVLNYFQNDPQNLDLTKIDDMGYNATYLNHLDVCFRNPVMQDDVLELPCMGAYGGPVFPYTALGGFLTNGSTDLGLNPAYTNATALVVTFVVKNHKDKNDTVQALAWEKEFLAYLRNFSHPLLDIAYSAERAIQDELERESKGDVFTVLVSYVLMFGYIVLSIGQFSGCRRLAIDSKVTLGLCGVLIVLVSVTAAVGVYALIGVPVTLIIIEVIPFLVLAVGVDNMFLLVHGVQTAEKLPTETRPQQLGRVMGEVAPTLLISTGSEAACFFLGALSPMPAVRAFALYAGLALTIDFLLQITCFLAVLTLDHARQESNRVDVLCCIKLRTPAPSTQSESLLTRGMRQYGKLLTKRWVKATVIVLFSFWSITSLPFVNDVPVGLDQELSMPEDSYLLKYFSYLGEYLSVGPPVYFVLKPGLDFDDGLEAQNKVCGTIDCGNESLVTELYLASRIANSSSIARPASSWLDDYISWSLYNIDNSDLVVPCCRTHENGSFCPSSSEDDYDCSVCDIQTTDGGLRPTSDSFNKYLPFFLEDNPSGSCPKAGHAAYGGAVKLQPADGNSSLTVGASYFMTYHTILRTSKDYYLALERARSLAVNITREINQGRAANQTTVEVFPYSVFYVFYEQYLTIYSEAVISVLISIGTVFLVMLVFSGFDFYSSVMVALGLFVLLINMAGCMYWFGVSLNAVSLVNIIMSVGIFVEFLSHLVFAFARVDHPDPDHRMVVALVETGTSVLSGITITKIVGVSVLAFAHSQIFKVFYFRMYLFIVVLGATHGLIWMPVLLSILGARIPASSQHANTNTFTRISEDYYSPSSIHQQAARDTTHTAPASEGAAPEDGGRAARAARQPGEEEEEEVCIKTATDATEYGATETARA